MCGIIGVFNNAKAEEQVKIALAALKNRGKDASNILNINENGALGHNLHAIISNIPQPLKGKGILTANCEIYNWQELNKKYQFNVQNDAEVLLKLLDNFGLEYRFVSRYLRGFLTYEQMVEKLFRAIKNYAKRQMRWFNRNPSIKWVKKLNQAVQLVRKFIR